MIRFIVPGYGERQYRELLREFNLPEREYPRLLHLEQLRGLEAPTIYLLFGWRRNPPDLARTIASAFHRWIMFDIATLISRLRGLHKEERGGRCPSARGSTGFHIPEQSIVVPSLKAVYGLCDYLGLKIEDVAEMTSGIHGHYLRFKKSESKRNKRGFILVR